MQKTTKRKENWKGRSQELKKRKTKKKWILLGTKEKMNKKSTTFSLGGCQHRWKEFFLSLFFRLHLFSNSVSNISTHYWIFSRIYLRQRECLRLDSSAAVDSPLVHIDRIPHCLCTIWPNRVFGLRRIGRRRWRYVGCFRRCRRRCCAGDQSHYYCSISNVLIYSRNHCCDCDYFCYCYPNSDCFGLARTGIPAAPFHHEIYKLV